MGALRVLNRHLRVFSHIWQHDVMFTVVEPLFYLTAFGLGMGVFVQDIAGMTYLEFLAPGMVTLSAMYAATFECSYGTFVRIHHQKTSLALLAGPVTARDVILGEMLYGTLKSTLFGTVVLAVVAAALAGYDLTDEEAIHATRGFRALMHGFISLEGAGGFGLPIDVDRSFALAINGFARQLADW